MKLSAFFFLIALFYIPALPIAFSQPSSSPSMEQSEQELIKARRANEEAQADYYRAQTEKLHEQPNPKSLWQSIKENPASLLGAIAALVALISFIYNYRATLRNQRDTQFYEALKRFGDKDSPTVRSSAAGILAQMGMRKAYRYRVLLKKPFIKREHHQYLSTTLDQLITGLLLEENLVCLSAISDAIKELVPYDPKMSIQKLYEANLRIQNDLCILLSRLWSIWGSKPPVDLLDKEWERVSHLAGYDKWVLQDFIKRHDSIFTNSLERFSVTYKTLTDEQRREILIDIEKMLEIASMRLKSNVRLFCLALHEPLRQQKDEFRFYGIFLVSGDLMEIDLRLIGFGGSSQLTGVAFYSSDLSGGGYVDAYLNGAGLSRSNLSDTWLTRANLKFAGLQGAILTAARLHSAYIDDSTKLDGANWWKADFFHYLPAERNNVDSRLLDNLFRRYGDTVPKDTNELHSSVRLYLESRKEPERATEKPIEDDSQLINTV